MTSTQYESRRLYSLHIFKDTPSSNWSNPTIHVFPLSSQSAHKFGGRSGRYARSGQKGYPGNRDGVVNLYRLPTDQLSFLEGYVGRLNAEVEERKGRLAREWKDEVEKEAKENFERGMRREEERRKFLEAKREYLREKEKEREQYKVSAVQQGQGDRDRIGKKASNRDIYRPQNHSDYDSDDTAQERPARTNPKIFESPSPYYRGRDRYGRPIPPPPAPPLYRAGRVVSLAPNPSAFETPWTIEDVELTFTPSAITLVPHNGPPKPPGIDRTGLQYFTEKPNTTATTYSFAKDGSIQTERATDVKLHIATNVIAPESYTSFAVLLSRCQGVEVPEDGPRGANPYRRERDLSPTRSYYSDDLVGYEDEDWATEVIVQGSNIATPPQYQVKRSPGAMPPADCGEKEQGDGENGGEGEGGKAREEVGREEEEERVETESRAGEEGEACDEGAVYISVVKKGK